jgi:hypothetical protein
MNSHALQLIGSIKDCMRTVTEKSQSSSPLALAAIAKPVEHQTLSDFNQTLHLGGDPLLAHKRSDR